MKHTTTRNGDRYNDCFVGLIGSCRRGYCLVPVLHICQRFHTLFRFQEIQTAAPRFRLARTRNGKPRRNLELTVYYVFISEVI